MKLHRPSLMHYLEREFDGAFNLYVNRHTLYIVPPLQLARWEDVQAKLIQAICAACESPLASTKGPEARSLFEQPPEPHIEALRVALRERGDYAQIHHIHTQRGRRVEYRVNLKTVQEILVSVRREQDIKLAVKLIAGEFFMSERLLNMKLKQLYGREFSQRRIKTIMEDLVTIGYCKNNGNLRTAGRDVLKWPKP